MRKSHRYGKLSFKVPNRFILDGSLSFSARRMGVALYGHHNPFGACRKPKTSHSIGTSTGRADQPNVHRYSQLASTLSISSSGGASCNGRVAVLNGYKADLTVELKQDGITIKTWTSSGSGTISAGGTYYVASGHSYYVTATAKVYNSSGTLVESPSKNSPSSSY